MIIIFEIQELPIYIIALTCDFVQLQRIRIMLNYQTISNSVSHNLKRPHYFILINIMCILISFIVNSNYRILFSFIVFYIYSSNLDINIISSKDDRYHHLL